MSEFSIAYASDDLQEAALILAKQLDLPCDKNTSWGLYLTRERLELKIPHCSPLSVDFSLSNALKRASQGKKQGIIRACKPSLGLKIIDATGGWGRDAAILAASGADVLMLERHPVMAALLADALLRCTAEEKQKMHLSLLHLDALDYLAALTAEEYPDIIYIDPMHPQRTKSALVKKEMQALHSIIGPDKDAMELIELSLTRVKKKVIVKWPQKLKPLIKVDRCVDGKTVRFDIYCP